MWKCFSMMNYAGFVKGSPNILVRFALSNRKLSYIATQRSIPDAKETTVSSSNNENATKGTKSQQKAGQKIMHFQKLRIYKSSAGTILDPFVPPSRFLISSLFTLKGWKEQWKYLLVYLRVRLAIFMIKRRLKGWKSHDFTNQAERIYIQMNEALAQRDKNRLHDVTTESFYVTLRREWSNLYPEGVYSTWKYVGRIDKPKIAHVAVAHTQDKNIEIAQITVRLNTLQSLCIHSKDHHPLSGDLEKSHPVNDLVYERNILDPNGRWRVCGKLCLPKN
jgi:hypothetical protein